MQIVCCVLIKENLELLTSASGTKRTVKKVVRKMQALEKTAFERAFSTTQSDPVMLNKTAATQRYQTGPKEGIEA